QMMLFDVSSPDKPAVEGWAPKECRWDAVPRTGFCGRGDQRNVVVIPDVNFERQDGTFFSGDVAVSSWFQLSRSLNGVTIVDVTDPLSPEPLADRYLA